MEINLIQQQPLCMGFFGNCNIVGVIVNRVASETHYQLIKGAIERYTDIEVLGYFPKNVQVEPSRHLGLIPDVEMDDLEEKFASENELNNSVRSPNGKLIENQLNFFSIQT